MAKGLLTAQEVRRLSKVDGVHRVGPALYLRVRGSSALWTWRYTDAGKAHEYSMGAFGDLTLADAVAKVSDLRARVKRGEELPAFNSRRRNETAVPTKRIESFRDVAEALCESLRAGWKGVNGGKHGDDWINSLRTYAFPVFGDKPVGDVSTDDVLAALNPIWRTKTETATRVRQRIEAVLSAAKARGLRTGENPAAWRGHLDTLLPMISKRRRVEHHPAMPRADLPAFMADLQRRSNMSAWALQFTILTACRTGEVIGAQWSEIDLARDLWVIPASRMKAHVEHRVPLSRQALALLGTMPRNDGNDAV
ncbi:MAG: integrase, partial [Thiomonas sp. 20-64-5]